MIRALYEKFLEAERKSNDLDMALELYPGDENIERKWVTAYREEQEALEALVDEIHKGGDSSKKDIRKAILSKRDELEILIAGL